ERPSRQGTFECPHITRIQTDMNTIRKRAGNGKRLVWAVTNVTGFCPGHRFSGLDNQNGSRVLNLRSCDTLLTLEKCARASEYLEEGGMGLRAKSLGGSEDLGHEGKKLAVVRAVPVFVAAEPLVQLFLAEIRQQGHAPAQEGPAILAIDGRRWQGP